MLDPGSALAAQHDLGYSRPDLRDTGIRRSRIAPVDVLDVRYPIVTPYRGGLLVLEGYGRFCEAAYRGVGIESCIAESPADLGLLPDECFISRDVPVDEARRQVAGAMRLLPLYRQDANEHGVDIIDDLLERVGYGICFAGR
jgi:hypothetical protein